MKDLQAGGYSPYDALIEHNKERAQAIDRQIVTKPKLNDYTELDLEMLSGDMIKYNITEPMSIMKFEKLSAESQKYYLEALIKRYGRIPVTGYGKMFKCHPAKVREILKTHGLYKLDKSARCSESFVKEILQGVKPIEKVEPKLVSIQEIKPVPKETVEEPKEYGLNLINMCFDCEAEHLRDIVSTLPLYGRVQISINQIYERRP